MDKNKAKVEIQAEFEKHETFRFGSMAFIREWFFRQSQAHNKRFYEVVIYDAKPLQSSSNARGRLIYSEYMFEIYKTVHALNKTEMEPDKIKEMNFASFQEHLNKLLNVKN